MHEKPIVLVNVNGFFEPLKVLLEHHVRCGFARSEIHELYRMVADPEEAIRVIEQALAAMEFSPA